MNRMKHIVLILLAILSVFCFTNQGGIKTIENFIVNDLDKITKIDITRGDGNNETVADKKLIKDIYAYLSNLKFVKVQNRIGSGWSYALNLYEGKKDILTITFIGEEHCIFNVNGDWYKIIKSTDVTIESLFNKAKKD